MATSALPLAPRAAASPAGLLPLVGRILIAAIFLLSGFSKLTAPAATIGYIASAGLPAPTLAYAVALAVELGGRGVVLDLECDEVDAGDVGHSADDTRQGATGRPATTGSTTSQACEGS